MGVQQSGSNQLDPASFDFEHQRGDVRGEPEHLKVPFAKAAGRILDARRKAAEDIAAGRAAPYYLSAPPAPSRPAPTHSSDDDDSAMQ